MVMKECKCVSCGGTNVEPGKLTGTGEVSFKPEHTKFLKAATSNVGIKANMCMDCGCLVLVGDVEKVKAITE